MISEVDWLKSLVVWRNESLRSLFMKSTVDVQILAYLTSWGAKLLDINLCIKSGVNTFSPPPRQVYLFKVTVNLYFGGGTKARICWTTCRGQIQNGVLSLEAWWFFYSKPDQNILCGDKNGKEICYRILACTEMGVWVLKAKIIWTVREWRHKHREIWYFKLVQIHTMKLL